MAAALRAPLGGLFPALDTAGAGPDSTERRCAYQLLRCAENLELFATLQRPARPGRPLDLAAAANCLLQAAQTICRVRPGQLTGESCPVPLPVVCNARALYVVVYNLLGNSLLYGGSTPQVQLEASRQGGRAVLTVRDAGPGMPPAVQLRAQTAFFSAAGPDGGPGVGLGLTLAALFARQAHGVFTLESRPGQGTTATLALPLCPAASLPQPPTPATLLTDRYSPLYVQLCQSCVLPG